MANSPMAAAVHKLTSELDACKRRIRKLERENDQLRRQVASTAAASSTAEPESQPALLEAPSVSSVSACGTPPNHSLSDEAVCTLRPSRQASLSTFSPNLPAHRRGVSVDAESDFGGDSISIGLSSSFGRGATAVGPTAHAHNRSQSYDPLHLGGTIPSLNVTSLLGSTSGGAAPASSGVHALRRRLEALERREESWKEQVAVLAHQLDALRNEKDEQLAAVQRNAEDLVTQLQQTQQQLQVHQLLQASRTKRDDGPWSPMAIDGGNSSPNGVPHHEADATAHPDSGGGSLSAPDSKCSSLTAQPADLERSVSNRKRSKSMVVLKQQTDGPGGRGELFAELPKEDLEEDIFMTHANHVRTLSNNLVPMSAIVSGAASLAPSGPQHGERSHGAVPAVTSSSSCTASPATSDARGPITNPNQLGDAFPEGVKDKRWYVHRVVRMALKRALSNDIGFRTGDMVPIASPTAASAADDLSSRSASALPSLQGKPLGVVNMMVKEAFELHYYIKDNVVVQSDAELSNLPPFHKQNSDPILLQHFSSSATGTTASSVESSASPGTTTFPRLNARSDQIRVVFTGLTLFSYIRAFLHFDIDMFLRSVEDAMWRESTSPGKSEASMYFFGNYVIKSVKESEYRFLKDAYLGMFARYAELNPHTLISRIYSLFSVYFVKKGTRRHYILMNNVFWTKHYINRIFDIKGSSAGRDVDSTAGHRTAFGALLLKDNDLPLQLIICGPMKRATLLAQLRSDTSFLASLSVVDYSCIIGIRTRVFSRENRHREQQQRASAAFDTEVFSFTAADGGVLSLPIYAENDSTTVREDTYYIGLIDVLQTYTPQKRLEHFAKGLLRDKHTISIVPPGEFSERLCKLLERITV